MGLNVPIVVVLTDWEVKAIHAYHINLEETCRDALREEIRKNLEVSDIFQGMDPMSVNSRLRDELRATQEKLARLMESAPLCRNR